MVKRKPQSSQQKPQDEGVSAKETIIEAEEIAATKPVRALGRAEIISAVAAVLSLGAIGLALWPVLTTKMTNQRQAELSQRVDGLSAAVESLVAAQTELAEAMVAQQGLSGALKTDLNKLTQQAGSLTTELRSELENLARQLEKSQQDFLSSLSLPAAISEPEAVPSPSETDSSSKIDGPSKIDNMGMPSDPGQATNGQEQTSLPADEEAPWLPQWVEVPMENLAGWFSSLVTVRKHIPDETAETPEAGENLSR